MRPLLLPALLLAAAAMLAPCFLSTRPGPEPADVSTDCNRAHAMLRALPVAFLENRGQWDDRAQFAARLGPMTCFVERRGWSLVLEDRSEERGVALRMSLVDDGAFALEAEERLPGSHHYLLGADSEAWQTDVPGYASLLFREVRSGMDVRLREAGRRLEYDLLCAPGADLSALELEVEGADGLRIEEDGTLAIATALGDLRQAVPTTWEVGPDGSERPLPCRYQLRGPRRYGFAVPAWQGELPLVVDPKIEWSTFVGGSGWDTAHAVAANPSRVAIVGFTSNYISYPTTPGAFKSAPGQADAFVTVLDANGGLLRYSSCFGGYYDDEAFAVAIDAQHRVTVAGRTASWNFPTRSGAWWTAYKGGGFDGFVSRLDATGGQLLHSTFLGGTDRDDLYAVALAPNGDTVVAGVTWSDDYPTSSNALGKTYGANGDAMVTRLNGSLGGPLPYSSYLGGGGVDAAHGVAVDAAGVITLAGHTNSFDFPTNVRAWNPTINGGDDVFVTRLNGATWGMVYSTYVGGSDDDFARALFVDPSGSACVTGRTRSNNYPTTPAAYDRTHNGGEDAFVTRVTPDGALLATSTLLGGSGDDSGEGIFLGLDGELAVAGTTSSTNFPTTLGAWDRSHNGKDDIFVTQLDDAGQRLLYSTYLGGTGQERSTSLAAHGDKVAVTTGQTGSGDYPTTPGVYDRTHNGSVDAFVTRVRLLPRGVLRYGFPTPQCWGPVTIHALDDAVEGSPTFGLACEAPPNAAGLLMVSLNSARAIPVYGFILWIDPAPQISVLLPVLADRAGRHGLVVPLLVGSKGLQFFAQYAWLHACGPQWTAVASDALHVIVQ